MDFVQANPLLAQEILHEISNIEKALIDRFVLYLYNTSGMEPEKIYKIMETISPETTDAFDEYRLRLIEQGIEKGLKKIAVNMITRGYSDEQIAEITNLSINRIHVLRKECSD
jgi:hypothetical protein